MKRPSPTLVGFFVLGAIALLVLGVVIFGGGRFFQEKQHYVLFFSGSVKGLNVGAPVVFRGVRIGSVTDIKLEADLSDFSFRIPVIIEVDPESFTRISEEPTEDARKVQKVTIDKLVEAGLRAQLQMQSIVTGQLLVQLDILPDTRPRFAQVETEHIQLPTIPTHLEQISQTFEKIPLEEIIQKGVSTLEGIERLVNAPALGESIRGLDATLEEVQELVQNMNRRLDGTAPLLRETLKEAQQLLRSIDEQVEPLLATLRQTSQTGQETLEETRQAMSTIDNAIGEDSEVRYKLGRTLEDVSAAARSLRALADYLEQNPGSLLRGRTGEE